MNANLEYLADSLIIEALAKDDMIVLAQEGGIVSSVAEGIKDYVSDLYDSNRPVASVVSFLGPGLLWKLGFPWMSVLYTVADALGFDWKSFWGGVGKAIAQFVKVIIKSKQSGNTSAEENADVTIKDIVTDQFESSFTGEVDEKKIYNLARSGKFATNMKEALQVKAFALELQRNPSLMKEAGGLRLFKGKLARFFIRIISWAIKTALISLGFFSAAGAVSGLAGESEGGDQALLDTVKVSPNAPPDIFTVHPNDMSRVWIERGNIESVDDLIKGWVMSVYPDYFNTPQKVTELERSPSFRSMVGNFKTRNRLAGGLGMISIPRPYQRKSDIVATIMSGLLKEHSQSGNNVVYK